MTKVPVVVLSAAGIDGLRQASRLQATAVLSKPLDLDRRGVHSIAEALDAPSLHRL